MIEPGHTSSSTVRATRRGVAASVQSSPSTSQSTGTMRAAATPAITRRSTAPYGGR